MQITDDADIDKTGLQLAVKMHLRKTKLSRASWMI